MISPELIKLFTKGDHDAFNLIFYKYYPRVNIFLNDILKSSDIAQEISQNLFVQLWLKREKTDPSKNFNAYIYVLARNSAINYLKSKSLHSYHEAIYCQNLDMVSPEEELFAKDLDLLIKLIVSRMPKKRQKVFELSRDKFKTNDEIAKELNISKKTVEKHLRLALDDIKSIIQKVMILFLLS